MYGVLSQVEVSLSLKNAWLHPIFLLDTKSTYYDLLTPDSFKPCRIINVLVSITDRKPEHLEMHTKRMRNNNSRHRPIVVQFVSKKKGLPFPAKVSKFISG